MARGKKYPDEDVERGLQALAENGGNAEAASRATDIPANTLRGWKNNFVDEFVELRREKRIPLIDRIWEAAGKALDQTLAKLPEASAKEAGVIMAILVDKALLMGGEPTDISEVRGADARSSLMASIEREMEDPEPEPEEEDHSGAVEASAGED